MQAHIRQPEIVILVNGQAVRHHEHVRSPRFLSDSQSRHPASIRWRGNEFQRKLLAFPNPFRAMKDKYVSM